MIYLTGSMSAPKWAQTLNPHPEIGMLLSPLAWRFPHSAHYALDNDVFAHSFIGSRPTPDFWEKRGETAWLKMLDKIPQSKPPMWILLPDVVADWEATIERAWKYRNEVVSRGFRIAIALQNGADDKSVFDFSPDAIFVGGTTEWKWANAGRIARVYGRTGIWTHLARCNGRKRILYSRMLGYDSADGTGLCRFTNSTLPKVLRGLRDNF
jgi:hypothetical protein